MKPGIALGMIAISLLAMSIGAAHTWEQQACQRVWLTPDHWGYGIEVFIDDLRLFFSFDPASKAKLASEIAAKRACESKLMAQAGNLEAFLRAQREHGRMLKIIQDQLEKLPPDKLLEQASLMEDHENGLMNLSQDLRKSLIKHQLKEMEQLGKISNSTLELHRRFLEGFQGMGAGFQLQISEIKAEILNQIKKLKPKISERRELEHQLKHLENITEEKCSRAEDQLERAEEIFMEVDEEARERGMSEKPPVAELLRESKMHLDGAKSALNEKDCGRAFGLARAAEMLARNAERFMQRAEIHKRLSAQISIANNTSKVILEVGSMEYELEINTTSLAEILKFISEELGLTPDQLRKLELKPVLKCMHLPPPKIYTRAQINVTLRGEEISKNPLVVYGCPKHMIMPYELKLKIERREGIEEKLSEAMEEWREHHEKLKTKIGESKLKKLEERFEQMEQIIEQLIDEGKLEHAQQMLDKLEQSIAGLGNITLPEFKLPGEVQKLNITLPEIERGLEVEIGRAGGILEIGRETAGGIPLLPGLR